MMRQAMTALIAIARSQPLRRGRGDSRPTSSSRSRQPDLRATPPNQLSRYHNRAD